MFSLKNIFSNKKTNTPTLISSIGDANEHIFFENFSFIGGHLIKCEDEQKALQELEILCQKLALDEVLCFDQELKGHLNVIKQEHNNLVENKENEAFYTPCESLIAFDGNILVSSDQISKYNPNVLPKKFIFFAYDNQISASSSEALSCLRANKQEKLPNNITTIRGKNSNNFGLDTNVKDLYLLLVKTNNE